MSDTTKDNKESWKETVIEDKKLEEFLQIPTDFLNDMFVDSLKVQTYLASRDRRRETKGRKISSNIKEDLIPSFEKCLDKLCANISKCYDLKTHQIKIIRSCQRLRKNYTLELVKQPKAETFSYRELAQITLALEQYSIIECKDERLKETIAKIKVLASHIGKDKSARITV